MATHSVKKRKRTDTPMSAAGRGDSGKSDRRAPLPSPPRGATATAVASARENRSPSEPRPRKARAQRGQSRERQPHRVLRRTAAGGGLLGDQRCCVACGVGDDGGDRTALWKAGGERVRCAACDGEYHPGCVDRPGPYAPKRTKAKGEGQEAEDEDEEEGWVCGVCEEVALVRKPSGGDVAGPRESQSCSRPSSFGAGAGSQPAVAKAAPRRQQQRQQQQVGAAASHARFMDVMSSALTRLAGLSGDGGGARGSNETAVEKDAIREAAAAVTAMSSTSKSPGGWCRKTKSAASMTDGLLGWALRSVGGTGEEGKPRGNLDGHKGIGDHRERIEECGPDVRLWSPSPVGGKRRGDEHPRRRGAGDVPGGEREGSLANGYGSGSGDSDSGNPGGCLSGGGSGDDDSGSGCRWRWRSTPSPPSPGERASRGVGMARGRDEGSLENFGDVDGDGGGDWIEGGVKSEDETNDGDKRKEPGFWEKDGNTRFLQGVTKHGDAWARLARRHAEIGVVEVNVDASDQDSIDGSDFGDYDDYGDYGDFGDYDEAGYSCGGSGEDGTWGLTDASRAQACSATMGNSVDGVEGDEYRDRRRRCAVMCPAERKRDRREREQEQQRRQGGRREDAPTSAREPKSKKRGKRPSRVKERKRRRDRLWDEEEHARFVEGFNKHGNAWADVAQVVGTRDQGEVERHAARWVDRSGKQLRDKASAIRTGGWDAEEQARFLEGLGQYGRSWPDIARVVRTRTSRQARAHAQYLFEKEDRVTNRVLQRLASNAARTVANLAPGHQKQTAPDTAASAPAHGASAPKGLRAGTVCASPNRAPRRKAAAEAIARLQSTAAADPEDVGSDGDDSDDDDGSDDDDDADDNDGSGVDDEDEDEDADTDHESTLSLSSSSCAAPEAVGGGAAGSVGGEGKGRGRGRGGQRRPRSLAGEDTRHWGAGERGGSSEGERGYAAGNGTTAGSEQKSQRKKKEGRNRYRYWDQDEHERFLKAHAKYGNSWFDVARAVGTRTRLQVYNHAQRVLKRRKSSGEVGSEKEA